jgi:hypothetical protein
VYRYVTIQKALTIQALLNISLNFYNDFKDSRPCQSVDQTSQIIIFFPSIIIMVHPIHF